MPTALMWSPSSCIHSGTIPLVTKSLRTITSKTAASPIPMTAFETSLAAWGLCDPGVAPAPLARTEIVEQRTLGDAFSGVEALEHAHNEDGAKLDDDNDVTRPLVIERMFASGQYFIVPSVFGTGNGTAVTPVVDPPAGG